MTKPIHTHPVVRSRQQKFPTAREIACRNAVRREEHRAAVEKLRRRDGYTTDDTNHLLNRYAAADAAEAVAKRAAAGLDDEEPSDG